MTDPATTVKTDYQPPSIEVPSLYAWPPEPLAALRWLTVGLLFPWGMVYLGLAVLSWQYLTPSMETMATFSPGWVSLIWLRNAALLTLVAGTLHWWLYIRRGQGQEYKFNPRWPAQSRKFLWGSQVKDNLFWSLVSGVTFWTLYEAVTYWLYASGYVRRVEWSEAPVYLTAMVWGVFFWSTAHFYLNHRLLHWSPLYRVAHELHHRNPSPGPWSGIAMHPLEHLIYFTVFCFWWVVPVHPVIILMTGFFQGISPAVSHCGFDYVTLGKRIRVSTGDLFHQLHHKYFEVNYGNTPTPIDKFFGSWHDGTAESLVLAKQRRRGVQVA